MSQFTQVSMEFIGQHRFFVGIHRGHFSDDDSAVAAAQLPVGSKAHETFFAVDGSRFLPFKLPPGTSDTKGLDILILEKIPEGVRLWQSSTDLSRPTRQEADDDVENFKEVDARAFRVFERP